MKCLLRVSKLEAMKMKKRFTEKERIRRIPRVERNKNMKIQDMLFTEIGVLLV